MDASVDETGATQPVNMCDWISYTTFDIIGNLTFGSDLGCLERSAQHPWIGLIMGSLKNMATIHALKALRILPATMYLMSMLGVSN